MKSINEVIKKSEATMFNGRFVIKRIYKVVSTENQFF